MLPVGFGVRPPGWFGSGEESDEEGSGDFENEALEQEVTQRETPEVVEDEESWRQLNNEDNGRENRQVEKDRSRSRSRRRISSSDNSSDSSLSSENHRRRQKHHQSKSKRRRRESPDSGRFRRSNAPSSGEAASMNVDAFRGWTMPELPEKLTFDELRQEWPTWKNMLLGMFRMKERNCPLTEEDKLTLLLTRGGKVVRDIHAYQPAVQDEVPAMDTEPEPQFTNLLKRCDFYFKARDPTTEITVLRGMRQGKEEPIRDFLSKARKQIRLCGYRSFEEQERELVMLLKTNCLDAEEISKQSMGRSAGELEALAVSLEELRRRGSMAETIKPEVKKEDDEDIVHAIASGYNRPSSFNRARNFQQRSGWQGNEAGRRGGYNGTGGGRFNRQSRGVNFRQKPRCFDCGSESHLRENCNRGPVCYTCGSNSHLMASCPKNDRRQGGRSGMNRVNQLRDEREEYEEENKVKSDDWKY